MRRSLLLFLSLGLGWLAGCGARSGEDELMTSDLSLASGGRSASGGEGSGGESGSGGRASGGAGTGGLVTGGEVGSGGIATGGDDGSGGSGVGNCCDDRRTVGCSVPEIESCVCDRDPYCCESGWDRQCVLVATQSCGVDCSDPGTGGTSSGGAPGTGGVSSGGGGGSGGGAPGGGGRPGTGGVPNTGGQGGNPGGGGVPGSGGLPGTGGIGGAPPTGENGETCCQARQVPGCSDPGVQACVCLNDPYCCNGMWDDICVDGTAECGASCGGAACNQIPDACPSCACNSCYVSLLSCLADEGCTCVFTTGCSGLDCLDPDTCGSVLGGSGAFDSLAIAVELASCAQTSNCGCF